MHLAVKELKGANYTNRFRISWKDIFRYDTNICNHYVIWSAILNRSHGDIHIYLESCSVMNRWDFISSQLFSPRLASKVVFFFQNAFTSDERNTSKIETSSSPPAFGTMLIVNNRGHLLMTVTQILKKSRHQVVTATE